MEKITLNSLKVNVSTITREGMNMGEFLYTLLYLLGYDLETLEEQMLERSNAKWEFGKVRPSLLGIEKAKRILGNQTAVELSKEELSDLARRMKDTFPRGIMVDGIPWTEGPILIVQRLEGFFKRFGNYNAEDIIKATERYVSMKRGSPYMRSLKNFIYKEEEGADGTISLQSDLYNLLENPDSLCNPLEDWTQELRE